MDYPLYIDGEITGTLRIAADGLMTRFEAECADTGKLTRISVYGGGKSAYLGLMLPKDGRMSLIKCLTKRAMEGFPDAIEYAADSERTPEKKSEPDTDGILWFSTLTGCLTAFDGRQSLIALPAEGKLGGDKGILRLIDGKYYAVFPGKSKKTLEK